MLHSVDWYLVADVSGHSNFGCNPFKINDTLQAGECKFSPFSWSVVEGLSPPFMYVTWYILATDVVGLIEIGL